MLLTLTGAYAAYLYLRQWWAGTGDAMRIVPLFYLLAVVGAAVCVALLASRGRLIQDGRLAWIASGLGVAGAAALGQTTAVLRLTNAPLQAAGDGLAGLYLLWHAALIVFTAGALFAPDRRRLRWLLVILFALGIIAGFVAHVSTAAPALVDAGDNFTPLYRTIGATLTVGVGFAAAGWILSCGRRPTRMEIWIGVGLALAAMDLLVGAGADKLSQAIWWSSAPLRAAQFVVPAGGLIAEALWLQRRLHRHERSLGNLLDDDRRAALQLLTDDLIDDEALDVDRMLAERDFDIVFQPIYSLYTGRPTAIEALTRFPTATPDDWFRAATAQGRGVELELATLQAALAALPRLPQEVRLAINISPATAVQPRLFEIVSRHRGHRLILEITEHAAVPDYPHIRQALDRLRGLGVLIAIDDAGAGFSSLQHVVHLSPDVIKLDMSLTRGIDQDPVRRALATSLTTFAQQMGIELFAEGIETAEELSTVHAIGAHAAQGYLLALPARLETELLDHAPAALSRLRMASGRQPAVPRRHLARSSG